MTKKQFLVYLKTNHRKISVLQQLVKDHPKSKRYQKLLNKAIKEQTDLQEATMKAYDEEYKFSAVLFMPDTCARKLFAGKRYGIFVNETFKEATVCKFVKVFFCFCNWFFHRPGFFLFTVH